jgi:hypothetical protein
LSSPLFCPQTHVITITLAELSPQGDLRIEASSTNPNATLTAFFSNGATLGQLTVNAADGVVTVKGATACCALRSVNRPTPSVPC